MSEPFTDPNSYIVDAYETCRTLGSESCVVQGWLIWIADKVSRGYGDDDYTGRLAAAVVRGIREHDRQAVAA